MTDLVGPSRPLLSAEEPRHETTQRQPGRFLVIVLIAMIVEAVLIAAGLAIWAIRDFEGFHATMGVLIGVVLRLADALPF